ASLARPPGLCNPHRAHSRPDDKHGDHHGNRGSHHSHAALDRHEHWHDDHHRDPVGVYHFAYADFHDGHHNYRRPGGGRQRAWCAGFGGRIGYYRVRAGHGAVLR
ncbi:uncharacterized protein P884DRAFT_290034, partial [Thermothelomyces heterothallicus CBS 202.75]|uniref:uncharacterized protein n=1 Tax=Thermothelomyces heterothallicus CBS 202.75 TaxID=1149848 RepID=UPI0037425087